jgi:hypothetical protein
MIDPGGDSTHFGRENAHSRIRRGLYRDDREALSRQAHSHGLRHAPALQFGQIARLEDPDLRAQDRFPVNIIDGNGADARREMSGRHVVDTANDPQCAARRTAIGVTCNY